MELRSIRRRSSSGWRGLAAAQTVLLLACASGSTNVVGPNKAPVANGEGVLGEWVAAGGLQRTYSLHLPTDYTAARRYPLLLGFHGAGGDREAMAKAGLVAAGTSHGFIVAVPHGVGSWALGCGGCTAADRTVNDVGFIVTLVGQLSRNLSIDNARIYAAGLSDGGTFVNRLACETTLAGAAVVAGTMFNSTSCRPPLAVPVIVFHGTADDVIPLASGLIAVNTWPLIDSCGSEPTEVPIPDRFDDGTTVSRFDYPGCRDGAAVRFFLVRGGGHVWPGSPVGLGSNTREIDASAEIVSFFSRPAEAP